MRATTVIAALRASAGKRDHARFTFTSYLSNCRSAVSIQGRRATTFKKDVKREASNSIVGKGVKRQRRNDDALAIGWRDHAGMVLRADPRRLLVSVVAEGVAKECATLAKTFRGPGAFARGDQLVRASLLVVSNIAEGCGRGTVPDFRRFLLHARGSAQETLAQLRLVEPATPTLRSIQSRTVLVLKLLNRLYAHPPPDK